MNCQRILFIFLLTASTLFVHAANSPLLVNPGDEISGAVLDGESKKPLSNVSITAVSNSNKEKKIAVSDNFGNYSFDNIKTGTYKLIFERSGYKKLVKESVYIREDELLQLNAELYENEPFQIIPGFLIFE